MPELPEVETVRRDLERDIAGLRIKDVEVTDLRSIRGGKIDREIEPLRTSGVRKIRGHDPRFERHRATRGIKIEDAVHPFERNDHRPFGRDRTARVARSPSRGHQRDSSFLGPTDERSYLIARPRQRNCAKRLRGNL